MSKKTRSRKLMRRIYEELKIATHGYQDLHQTPEALAHGAWVWESLTGLHVGSPIAADVLLAAPKLMAVEGTDGSFMIQPAEEDNG